jgi:Rrf2 family iron-sulfur cluster assembly transcriptional regulator
MKLINRDVDYAARALVFMARANKPTVSVAQMQEQVGVSGPFLRKTMQKLHRAGIVHAVKGKGGGFAMARNPENITLKHLMEVLQGPLKLNDCLFDKKLCRLHAACALRHRLADIESRLEAEVAGVTVKDLI